MAKRARLRAVWLSACEGSNPFPRISGLINMKRTGPMNMQMAELIKELKRIAAIEDAAIWKRVAEELERPTRSRRVVNLSRINRFCNNDETIIVPGKVLSSGELNKKVVIAAWAFSEAAKEKIKGANSEAIYIEELIKKNPKGSGVRIIG